MKKLVYLILLVLFIVACSNNNQQEEINKFVNENDYLIIVTKLDTCITNIQMFPEESGENEFIYYVQAIRDNINKFQDEERSQIYQKLLINYSFSYNSLNYTQDDYQNDLKIISK